MEASNTEHEAAYLEAFTCDVTGETAYKLKRDYWKDRENHDWSHSPDLF